MPRKSIALLIGISVLLMLGGCGNPYIYPAPVNRKSPMVLDDTYGQHYDLKKYEGCRKKYPNGSNCLVFNLRRRDHPEYWPYPEVPPMKWPDPPKQNVYRPGMDSVAYWRALCKAEAGEFIYRTVEADGLYQIRPRLYERTDTAQIDRFVMEDPYGYAYGDIEEEMPFTLIGPKERWFRDLSLYAFVESPPIPHAHWTSEVRHWDMSRTQPQRPGTRFQRYFGYDRKRSTSLRMVWVTQLKARYGWTWRGIRRPMDRELRVAGGELAVVDLHTNEILAVRRGFILGRPVKFKPESVSWDVAACPEYRFIEGPGMTRQQSKSGDFTSWFLTKVVKPIGNPYED